MTSWFVVILISTSICQYHFWYLDICYELILFEGILLSTDICQCHIWYFDIRYVLALLVEIILLSTNECQYHFRSLRHEYDGGAFENTC